MWTTVITQDQLSGSQALYKAVATRDDGVTVTQAVTVSADLDAAAQLAEVQRAVDEATARRDKWDAAAKLLVDQGEVS